jgi:hypothetical protein
LLVGNVRVGVSEQRPVQGQESADSDSERRQWTRAAMVGRGNLKFGIRTLAVAGAGCRCYLPLVAVPAAAACRCRWQPPRGSPDEPDLYP